MEGVNKELPVLEDPSSHAYYREEGGGLMVGLFEPHAAAWNVDAIPGEGIGGELWSVGSRSLSFLVPFPLWNSI